ncbi:MAG: porin [Thermoanaerobaculales bacterium]
MNGKVLRHRVGCFAVALAVVLLPALASGQAIVKVNDNVFFRFGIQMQAWGDWLQNATTDAYAQNLYLRRARFLLTGQVAPNVTFFFQTDTPNLGKYSGTSTKSFSPGFLIQDAWFEWKLAEEFALDAGEMIVPFSRNELNSTLSFLTLDISPTSTVFASPTQTNGTRDTGFMAHGYFGDGHLEYRAGVFQGVRTAAQNSSFLFDGYLHYNFLETEKGYVFAGTNLGKRKILTLSGGYQTQNSYRAYSGDVFTTLPIAGGDEFAGQVQWTHYDGQNFLASVPNQNDYLVELGYYVSQAKFQPFAKFESQRFVEAAKEINNVDRWGAGLNYYVSGQNLKLTGQYLRIQPKNSELHNTNEFTFQIQMFFN